MSHDLILKEKISDVLWKITLNRPEKYNALNLEMIDALGIAIKKLENTECRVVILDAAGPNFCTGLDLKQASDHSLINTMAMRLADMFKIFHDTPLVTIAAVRGHAIAGGGGLAASCDIVLLDEQAKMGFPEVHRGLVPAQVSAILIRQISRRHIRELLLTGQLVDSYRAVEIGLANYIVTQEDLEKEVLRTADEVLKGGPDAIRESKYLLDNLIGINFSRDIDVALSVHDRVRHSQEFKEGLAAFLEKRKPSWG